LRLLLLDELELLRVDVLLEAERLLDELDVERLGVDRLELEAGLLAELLAAGLLTELVRELLEPRVADVATLSLAVVLAFVTSDLAFAVFAAELTFFRDVSALLLLTSATFL